MKAYPCKDDNIFWFIASSFFSERNDRNNLILARVVLGCDRTVDSHQFVHCYHHESARLLMRGLNAVNLCRSSKFCG